MYKRGEEQLWDLINRIEKLKDLQRLKDESSFIQKQKQDFRLRLSGQVQEGELAHSQKKTMAQAERKEMDKLVFEYEEEKRAQKKHEERKRNQLFHMMQQSIENQKKNALSQERMERATDHLINPKEFQMMDQLERMRNRMSREKKKTDDL